MIGKIIKNPIRSLAFAVGAFGGSQVPYFPTSYQTYLEIKKEQSELLIDKYKEILQKKDIGAIKELYQEEINTSTSLNNRITSLENSGLAGKFGTIALDPKGTWGTIKHYHPGFGISNLTETVGYGLAFGILTLGLYEFLIKRPIKRAFSKNKFKKEKIK